MPFLRNNLNTILVLLPSWLRSVCVLSRLRFFVTYGPQPTRCLCPWASPGESTGVGFHTLLQGNHPDPGIEPASSWPSMVIFRTLRGAFPVLRLLPPGEMLPVRSQPCSQKHTERPLGPAELPRGLEVSWGSGGLPLCLEDRKGSRGSPLCPFISRSHDREPPSAIGF